MNYYKNVTSDSLEYHPEQILLDSVLPKPQKEVGLVKADPLLAEPTPPPLGDMPIGTTECEKKWQQIAMISKWASYDAMLKAKEEFMKSCNGSLGSSIIAEPEIITPTNPISSPTTGTTTGTGSVLPNLGAFLGSLTGGGSGGGSASASEEITETPKAKKPFPYWILIAGLVGGYLIFRKK
jgi:hypothetical protein